MKMKNEYEYGEWPPLHRGGIGWIPSRPGIPFPSIYTYKEKRTKRGRAILLV
jgi:hypothetical protein